MPRNSLRWAVGLTAVLAPLLHSLTDVMELLQHGFSPAQLWLNYIAFLPMAWLLLGIHAVHERDPGLAGLAGAVLYGAAFTYFAFTALYAIERQIPTYAALWQELGAAYTIHGALMVVGGALFGAAVLRAGWLPRWTALLFLAGLTLNLVLQVSAAPEMLQVIGSFLRNAGLVGMGGALLLRAGPGAP